MPLSNGLRTLRQETDKPVHLPVALQEQVASNVEDGSSQNHHEAHKTNKTGLSESKALTDNSTLSTTSSSQPTRIGVAWRYAHTCSLFRVSVQKDFEEDSFINLEVLSGKTWDWG